MNTVRAEENRPNVPVSFLAAALLPFGMRHRTLIFLLALFVPAVLAAEGEPNLPGTAALTNRGDLSAEMVAGIDRWLMRETQRAAVERTKKSQAGYTAEQQQQKRDRLRKIIGAVDELEPNPKFEFICDDPAHPEIYRNSGEPSFVVYRVRWPVSPGLSAEGLLLEPTDNAGKLRNAIASAIALPDADQSPEGLVGLGPEVPAASQFARRLAEGGWRVLVPLVVSRADTWSGNTRLKRFTNQPHREWIYRQGYELGRHIIGYEVEKTLAAVAILAKDGQPVAVAGYGEGGLIALHAAALDPRIGAALVSGYFGPRDNIWHEPIYRNLFGFLREFGDAELAALTSGKLIVEYSASPRLTGPPPARSGRSGAAPGAIATPDFGAVEAEVERANEIIKKSGRTATVDLIYGSEGMAVEPGSRKALAALGQALKAPFTVSADSVSITALPQMAYSTNGQMRAVQDLDAFTQSIFRQSEDTRNERVWRLLANTNEFLQGTGARRDFFWREVIGKIVDQKLPANPRSRQIYDKPKWTGYEVMLDVLPDVFAWGYLLVPKDLKPGERRPVVVCQHGLEGVPEDTVTGEGTGFRFYQSFAPRLAERGFIVYSPHNPYRGHDAFRVLQRKANPLGLSLFSFIIAQHEVATEWLAALPFVDPQRIAFYGLSYGGKTAMRVPAVVTRYCLSICSGDFNEWVQKNATTESAYSYMFTGEYEMPEWDLGHTFNYAEMASLIAPRPFMVERGHDDGVAPDTWVSYEYAKVRRMYDKLGIGDRTEIEFFNGPHQIHGVGTFKFLHRHLNWPEPQ